MSSNDIPTSTDSSMEPNRTNMIGCVKWFNNKAGYGFISLNDNNDPNKTTDVFVHHSAVVVKTEQYKYLVQGEYVSFDTSKTDNSEYEWQASNVRGVHGGNLMCETRFQSRSSSNPMPSRTNSSAPTNENGWKRVGGGRGQGGKNSRPKSAH